MEDEKTMHWDDRHNETTIQHILNKHKYVSILTGVNIVYFNCELTIVCAVLNCWIVTWKNVSKAIKI